MNTGISEILRAPLLAMILGVAACGNIPGNEGAPGLAALLPQNGKAQPVLLSTEFAGGRIVVRGPEGYCIDKGATRRGIGTGFALLAACRDLTGGTAGILVEPAILTVTIGAPGSAPVAAQLGAGLGLAMADFGPGEVTMRDGIALAHMSRGGDGLIPEADPRHWRGAMIQGDRLLALAVYGTRGSDVTGVIGRDLLRDLGRSIRAASPDGTPPAAADDVVVVATTETSDAANAPAPPRGPAGFLRRLFK